MATHNRFVVGLFDQRHEADTVVRELKNAGFGDSDLSTTHHGSGSGLVDYLEKHGVPNTHSHYYAEGVRRGGSLVKVFTDDDHYAKAVELMRSHGAVDMNKRASYYKEQGFSKYDESAPPYGEKEVEKDRTGYAGHDYDESKGETVLPEMEEEIHVGKQQVNRGGVRIFARKTEVPVEKHVTLRDETINVHRENVDRPASAADLESFKEGEMTLTETDEVATVRKEARVTGEVHVGKSVQEREEVVRDTATKTEVDVEKVEGTTGTATKTDRR